MYAVCVCRVFETRSRARVCVCVCVCHLRLLMFPSLLLNSGPVGRLLRCTHVHKQGHTQRHRAFTARCPHAVPSSQHMVEARAETVPSFTPYRCLRPDAIGNRARAVLLPSFEPCGRSHMAEVLAATFRALWHMVQGTRSINCPYQLQVQQLFVTTYANPPQTHAHDTHTHTPSTGYVPSRTSCPVPPLCCTVQRTFH